MHRVAPALLVFILAVCRQAPAVATPSPDVYAAAASRYFSVHSGAAPLAIGSAFAVDARGRALTCLHVVDAARGETLLEREGRRYKANLIHSNRPFDLALLQLEEAPEVAPADWIDQVDLAEGQALFALGAPYGLGASYLAGYVARVDRRGADIALPAEATQIQTYGLSYPGVSGAAVYTLDGRVIGMNRATYGFAPGTGVGLAVPARYLREFLETAP